MAFNIDEKGNITLIQGDSGTLVINGINTDKNYKVYFAVQDKNRNPVGEEIEVSSNSFSSVIFEISGNYTDAFTVSKHEPYATYYYGIKVCDEENSKEDTLLIASNNLGDVNTITVYPKKVEGI